MFYNTFNYLHFYVLESEIKIPRIIVKVPCWHYGSRFRLFGIDIKHSFTGTAKWECCYVPDLVENFDNDIFHDRGGCELFMGLWSFCRIARKRITQLLSPRYTHNACSLLEGVRCENGLNFVSGFQHSMNGETKYKNVHRFWHMFSKWLGGS